ncbi:MAG: GNAT family N-acetyltransferase [Alphaproteobacteria bacterium]|nr:GNAT family N-acetyltransferase [Alphaproteobacteria bacterium]OJV16043.1 MAG: hypothetical protein BGO27_04270 [Alphaproteobacteria bacterium 33-17]
MSLVIEIDEVIDEEVLKTIKNGIKTYNENYFGKYSFRNFLIYATLNEDEIIGGIYGSIMADYAKVDMLWVDEKHRKHKVGTQLMTVLEEYAKQKSCKYIQLDTFEFQAKPFYEKLGFKCIGTIPKWIKNYDCHFMRKEI